MSEFNSGDAVEVQVAGEWRRGVCGGYLGDVPTVGPSFRVFLEGDDYEHAFYERAVRKYVPPEPDYSELVAQAVAEAHGCGVAGGKEECFAVTDVLEAINAQDVYAHLIFEALGKGLVREDGEANG
jgi:hypothetical protein